MSARTSLKDDFIANRCIQFISTWWSHLAIVAQDEQFLVFQQDVDGGAGGEKAIIAGPFDQMDDAQNAMYTAAYCDTNFEVDKSTG